MLKEKPPPEGAAAASGSFFTAPKTKVDGAASFFSSGFPKANVGAAGSFPACKDPNVELTCGVPDATFGSPSLPKTDPLAVAVVVLVDVVSFDDPALSLFPREEVRGVKVIEDEDVVVVSGVLSADLVGPNVKPLLEEELLSVLDDPLPKPTSLLPPNFNPAPAAGWSDFLSSLDAAPNLKPSEDPPNLNPEDAVVSLEDDSKEELPNEAPNLNPPDDEDNDESVVPNLKLPDPAVLSDVPNLKPPGLEVEEPKVEVPEAPAAEEPKDPKAEEKQRIMSRLRYSTSTKRLENSRNLKVNS